MEDFDALAAALGAGIADLRGCLILSRDGLVLGSHPDAAEQELKESWLRFAELGEPERGFVQFGHEIWALVRRGPYGSFAVTGIGVRPGIVIDHMERVLRAAEDARSKGEGQTAATAPVPPAQASRAPTKSAKRKRRRSLHGVPGPIDGPVLIHAEPSAPDVASEAWPDATDAGEVTSEEAGEPDPAAEPSPAEPEGTAETDPGGGPEASDDEDEVDRFSLASEFSRLLQDERDDADG
ncbi:MAG: hypothetical protein WD965_05090 [Actinomycetota bacterium]